MSGEERTRAANAFAAAASAFRADRVSLSPPPVPTLAARAGREDMCARGRRLLYMCVGALLSSSVVTLYRRVRYSAEPYSLACAASEHVSLHRSLPWPARAHRQSCVPCTVDPHA